MGIFDKQNKEKKEQQKIEAFKQKYHLQNLDSDELSIVQNIASDLIGNGLFKAGMALSFAKAEEQAKVTYLSALVEQNWLIIRMLKEINSKLDLK